MTQCIRIVDASGAPIIKPVLRSIGAILLIATDHREMRVAGLLHPDAANPFNPQLLPNVPFVKFAGVFSNTNIATEWIRLTESTGYGTSGNANEESWP
jgi:hypothetical protein